MFKVGRISLGTRTHVFIIRLCILIQFRFVAQHKSETCYKTAGDIFVQAALHRKSIAVFTAEPE